MPYIVSSERIKNEGISAGSLHIDDHKDLSCRELALRTRRAMPRRNSPSNENSMTRAI